jgi:hypothetical protein
MEPALPSMAMATGRSGRRRNAAVSRLGAISSGCDEGVTAVLTVQPRLSAVGLAGLAVAIAVAAVGIATVVAWSPTSEIVGDIAYQAFTVVGVLLYLRRPHNAIGPLFVLAGVGSALAAGTGAVLRQVRDGAFDLSSPLIHLIGSIQTVAWLPSFAVPLVYVALLFPDGNYLSRRWARVGRVAAVAIALAAVTLVTLTTIMPTEQVLAPSPTVDGGLQEILSNVSLVGVLTMLGCGLLALASLLLRYRRSGEHPREQIKLVVFAVFLAVAATLLDGHFGLPANIIMPLGVPLIPVAVAVAVTRYRLYDIDRLVSRTVSYAVVTTLLVGLYAGLVALTTRALPFSSGLGVAASTLAAAAAFHPLRRHVQVVVDRRFNRGRYDAARVVAAFARNVRRTVEASTIEAELAATVQQTVQPSMMSVWVAPPR